MTNKQKITLNTAISDVLKMCSESPVILMEYNFPCVGCPMSQMETLGDGAKKHGLTGKKLDELLEKLNNACE